MMGGDDVWFPRPQPFFSCSLCPTIQMEDKASHMEFFAGVLQHIRANLSHPWQLHAEEWDSHAVLAGGLPASNTLCLPGGKRSWLCPADAMLPEREPSQHYSSFFAACSSGRRCCWFQARQQDRQQAFRSQHLDVALWESVPQEDLSCWCWRDAAEACTRSKMEGGWNLEAQKIIWRLAAFARQAE